MTEDVNSASELEEVDPDEYSYIEPDYPGDEAEDYRKYYKQANRSEVYIYEIVILSLILNFFGVNYGLVQYEICRDLMLIASRAFAYVVAFHR